METGELVEVFHLRSYLLPLMSFQPRGRYLALTCNRCRASASGKSRGFYLNQYPLITVRVVGVHLFKSEW